MPLERLSGPVRLRHSRNSELRNAAQEDVWPGVPEDRMLDIPPWEPQEAPEGLQEATEDPGEAPWGPREVLRRPLGVFHAGAEGGFGG